MPCRGRAACRPAPSGCRWTRADGAEARGHPHPADEPDAEPNADPRLRRQRLERPGCRRISPRAFPDDDVVAFHYRGYAPSTGSPSAEALIADAPLVYDAAVKRVKPEARHCGRVQHRHRRRCAACRRKRKLDGLILVTPFDSLKAVAQSMYPWLPIGPFFEHEIDAAAPLDGVDDAGRDHRRGSRRNRARRANGRAARRSSQPGVRSHDRACRPQRHLCAIGFPAMRCTRRSTVS